MAGGREKTFDDLLELVWQFGMDRYGSPGDRLQITLANGRQMDLPVPPAAAPATPRTPKPNPGQGRVAPRSSS
jgi:hypothetical protein